VLIQVLKSSKALLALAPLNLAFDRFSHSMHSIIKFLEHVSDAIECPALERDHETFWILRRRCHDVAINIGPINIRYFRPISCTLARRRQGGSAR
jgi:hypothetical protein